MGEQRSHRDVTVAPPKELVVAKRRVVPGPTDRSAGCPQKQSSPYIRRVQYTVLSVDGLKGTLSEAELFTLRTRLYEGRWNKARKGLLRFPSPVGYVIATDGAWVLDPDTQVRERLSYVFDSFRHIGVLRAVVHDLRQQGLGMPT